MLINGEKFACEACVRGHRVSACHHQDRPLIHVNKKGRPISQCHHCRGLRKARSQHVKCDCADKAHSKEDCPHDKGEKPEANTCCCGHGARCSCSLKKDHLLDTVPEDIPHVIHPNLHPKEPHKPRFPPNNHEPKTTIFQNGHHKPVHNFNDAHNHCGAPYKIPNRSFNLQSHRELAQRSSDSLPLTKTSLTTHETPSHHESITSAPQPVRQIKSEHNSPVIKAMADPVNDHLRNMAIPPFDPNAYSYSPFDGNSPSHQHSSAPDYQFPDKFPDSLFMSYEQAHDYDPPFPSGAYSEGPPEIDWSQFNFQNPENNTYNTTNTGYVSSQPPSYASFEHLSHLSHPGLTSSSGEVSDVEDYVPVSRPGNFRAGSSHDASNDFGSTGPDDASEAYRLSSASSYIGLPQVNMLATGNLETLDIDDYLKQAEAETKKMRLQNGQARQQQQLQQMQQTHQMQSQNGPLIQNGLPQLRNFSTSSNTTVGEHPLTVHEAQNYAHMRETNMEELKPLAMPEVRTFEDPMWASLPQTPGGHLVSDDVDDDWVR